MPDSRPNIALLVANITDPFSNQLSKGAMNAAKRLGADLTIFPGKYIGVQDKYDEYDTTYEYQYNALFSYAARGGFDHIIAAVGTIAYALDNEGKKEFLDKLGDTPVLSVAAEIDGYDSLVFDNKSGVYQIIDALAAQGRRHIGIMAGDIRNYDCLERYEAFIEGLERNGIAFDEKNFMSCDISEYCKAEAKLLIERSPELDAIVCVNDKVAQVVCEVLKEKGRRVGTDVAVTGFDDLPLCNEVEPPIATVRADACGLGERAVEIAMNRLGLYEEKSLLYPTEFICRGSCEKGYASVGFERASYNEKNELSQKMLERIHTDNIFVRDAMMFGGDMKNSYAKILKQMPIIGAQTAFIYTLEEQLTYLSGDRFPAIGNMMFRSYSYGAATYNVNEAEQRQPMKRVFKNPYLCSDRQHCFIALDLYTAQTQYGLALVEPRDEDFFSEVELVTYILSSAVRTLDILIGQDKLINEIHIKNLALEQESQIDQLTGLYNRRGFYLAADELLDKNFEKYIVCYADLDDLKIVNDVYGHKEGDNAIKLVAACLKKVLGNDAVIGRVGGDEFAAIKPANGDSAEDIESRRAAFVEKINSAHRKPYTFGVSLGAVEGTYKNGYDLKAALDKADDLLYIQKSEKKARRAKSE